MTTADLKNVIRWAEANENVRRLVLVGSRTRPERTILSPTLTRRQGALR